MSIDYSLLADKLQSNHIKINEEEFTFLVNILEILKEYESKDLYMMAHAVSDAISNDYAILEVPELLVSLAKAIG